jgi:hypothetical protein
VIEEEDNEDRHAKTFGAIGATSARLITASEPAPSEDESEFELPSRAGGRIVYVEIDRAESDSESEPGVQAQMRYD